MAAPDAPPDGPAAPNTEVSGVDDGDMTSSPRVALVTGTSSGIGLWTAVELAAAGLHVVATMRDPARATRLLEAADEAGVEVEVRPLDVTDAAAAGACIDGVVRDLGGVDVLVNNAGQGLVGTLEQLDDATLQAQLDVNYLAVARLTRCVLPVMRAAGRRAGRHGDERRRRRGPAVRRRGTAPRSSPSRG